MFIKKYPNHNFIVVSREKFKPLFEEDQNKFIETSEKIGDLQLLLDEKEDRWLELLEMENQ